MRCHNIRCHRIRPDTNRLPPNRPESSRVKDVGLDATSREAHRKERVSARPSDAANTAVVAPLADPGSPCEPGFVSPDPRDTEIETFEDATAAQRNEAADVLAAVADLVSASIPEAVETGQSFSGLARKLEELEARLQHIGRTDDAVAVKRALDHIEAQLRDPTSGEADPADPGQPAETRDFMAAVKIAREAAGATPEHYGASVEPRLGTGRARHPASRPPGIEIDAAIRNLTIRMAAVHREALRRGAWKGTAPSPAVPSASEGLAPLLEIGAGVGSGAPKFQGSPETRAGLFGLLRRLEAKIDALVRKVEAEAASAADRHQADLLARRIESTELQLVKRIDAGFAAVAVETRVVEDMLRGLAARCDAQGDLGRTLATLEQSVGGIREHLDRLEERLPSPTPAPHAIELGRDLGAQSARPEAGYDRRSAREHSVPDTARQGADRQAALDGIQDAIASIADRLCRIETHLSSARPGIREPGDGPASTFEHADDKARRSRFGQDADTEADVLIEPGSGFTPPLEARSSQATRDPGLDGDEGASDRTDFIEAARRAVRAAHRSREPRRAEPAPPEPREGLGAKAWRLARSVRSSIFPG